MTSSTPASVLFGFFFLDLVRWIYFAVTPNEFDKHFKMLLAGRLAFLASILFQKFLSYFCGRWVSPKSCPIKIFYSAESILFCCKKNSILRYFYKKYRYKSIATQKYPPIVTANCVTEKKYNPTERWVYH